MNYLTGYLIRSAIALAGLVAVTVLMASHTVATDDGMPIVTLIVGWAIAGPGESAFYQRRRASIKEGDS